MWEWNGICVQMVPPPLSHTYDLGVLEAGNYTFVFSVWNQTIKWINFSVNVDWNPWNDPNSEGGENITTAEDYALISRNVLKNELILFRATHHPFLY